MLNGPLPARPPAGILLGIKVAIYELCPMRRRSRSRAGADADKGSGEEGMKGQQGGEGNDTF